jgi:hypothetical protein
MAAEEHLGQQFDWDPAHEEMHGGREKMLKDARIGHPTAMKGKRGAEAMAKAHSIIHQRYSSTSHYHAGENRGPSQRPEGWKTGGDVVEKS